MKTINALLEGLLTFGLYIALWNLPFIFFFGGDWATRYWLDPLMVVGWVLMPLVIVAVVPLSIFKPLRKVTGKFLDNSTYILAFLAWYIGFIMAYLYWGQWGAVIGILLLGIGVVPVALLATAINGAWYFFSYLMVLTLLAFAAGFIGKRLYKSSH